MTDMALDEHQIDEVKVEAALERAEKALGDVRHADDSEEGRRPAGDHRQVDGRAQPEAQAPRGKVGPVSLAAVTPDYSASTSISGWSFSTDWPWLTRILRIWQSVDALISL